MKLTIIIPFIVSAIGLAAAAPMDNPTYAGCLDLAATADSPTKVDLEISPESDPACEVVTGNVTHYYIWKGNVCFFHWYVLKLPATLQVESEGETRTWT